MAVARTSRGDFAGAEDGVVEFFQREFFAEFAFRFRADVEDLELADFIGAGLSRHYDG